MKFQLFYTIAVFMSLIGQGCDQVDESNEQCIKHNNEFVTSVDAPETANINDPVNIQVDFRVHNGCGQFKRFMETINAKQRTIEVEAVYEGCMCTQDLPIRTATYQFVPDSPGNYELRFKSGPEEFITEYIEVN